MWGRVAVACRLNQYSTVPFTSYSMRCIKTCFIEIRILTTATFFTSHPTCWLVIVQEVKWNWSENCWVFGRLECGGLRGQPLPWFSEVSFKRISSCKMHTRSHYITKIYRPGSKCEALQLGVHLILLYFIPRRRYIFIYVQGSIWCLLIFIHYGLRNLGFKNTGGDGPFLNPENFY